MTIIMIWLNPYNRRSVTVKMFYGKTRYQFLYYYEFKLSKLTCKIFANKITCGYICRNGTPIQVICLQETWFENSNNIDLGLYHIDNQGRIGPAAPPPLRVVGPWLNYAFL